MRAVLANMGFVLQMAGILIALPIAASFYFNETQSTIALFLTAMSFLAFGFILNALCERKDLGFKESNAVVFFSFVMLGIIGAIPFLYLHVFQGDIYIQLTDSIFESVSGFTTTGFSMITDFSSLPKSLILYRSLTQFIGGIGIVLLLLALFYPEEKLINLSKSMGIGKNHKIKSTFLLIIAVYFAYSLAVGIISFLLGYTDLINLASLVFAAISTGGFAPVSDITPLVVGTPLGYMLMLGMVLGAMNFIALAGLFKLKLGEFMKSEVPIYIFLMIVSIALAIFVFNLSSFEAAFHIVSVMTTTGFGYSNISAYSESLIIFMSLLIFIGGTSFSTAGGIKIYRLALALKSIKNAVFELITSGERKVSAFGTDYSDSEIANHLVVIMLFAGTVLVSAYILNFSGYSFVDSIFESVSALTNTGISSGIAVPSLALNLKWLFIFVMLLGRVEIIGFLIILSSANEPIQKIVDMKNK